MGHGTCTLQISREVYFYLPKKLFRLELYFQAKYNVGTIFFQLVNPIGTTVYIVANSLFHLKAALDSLRGGWGSYKTLLSRITIKTIIFLCNLVQLYSNYQLSSLCGQLLEKHNRHHLYSQKYKMVYWVVKLIHTATGRENLQITLSDRKKQQLTLWSHNRLCDPAAFDHNYRVVQHRSKVTLRPWPQSRPIQHLGLDSPTAY